MLSRLIACGTNCASLGSSAVTLLYMCRHNLKNLKLIALQITNITSQSFFIFYYYLTTVDSSAHTMSAVANYGILMSLVSIFIIGQIDCDVLGVFSVLNSTITAPRTRKLRIVLIALFLVLVGPYALQLFLFTGYVEIPIPALMIALASCFTYGALMLLYGNLTDNRQTISKLFF